MDDSAHLERGFDAAMLDIYHDAARLGYRPTRFLEMVEVRPRQFLAPVAHRG